MSIFGPAYATRYLHPRGHDQGAGLSSVGKHVLRSPPGHSGPLSVNRAIRPAIDKEPTMTRSRPNPMVRASLRQGRQDPQECPNAGKEHQQAGSGPRPAPPPERRLIGEIVAATDWQPHSVRGFLSGAVKKRLGIDVVSEKGEDGVRRYHVAAFKS